MNRHHVLSAVLAVIAGTIASWLHQVSDWLHVDPTTHHIE